VTSLEQYEKWVTALEQGQKPSELKHIALTISGKARHIAREIKSFSWPATEQGHANALTGRAKTIGQKAQAADLQAYLEHGSA
jgi:hypothetical protein